MTPSDTREITGFRGLEHQGSLFRKKGQVSKMTTEEEDSQLLSAQTYRTHPAPTSQTGHMAQSCASVFMVCSDFRCSLWVVRCLAQTVTLAELLRIQVSACLGEGVWIGSHEAGRPAFTISWAARTAEHQCAGYKLGSSGEGELN